jgi:hypothetical protein
VQGSSFDQQPRLNSWHDLRANVLVDAALAAAALAAAVLAAALAAAALAFTAAALHAYRRGLMLGRGTNARRWNHKPQ